jgi:NarL family two-component system response regulator LiaR
MNIKPVRVLIADDHSMVRSAICNWIQTLSELELAGEASNGKEAVERTLSLKPDVILMDLVMPVADGIAATRAIIQADPQAKILIVTSFNDRQKAVESIQAGAQGFILKDASLEELLEAILAISKGRSWFSAELARSLVVPDKIQAAEPPAGDSELLTAREMEVLKLMVQGKSDREISARLVIAHSTVRFHVHQILEKLQADNRTQAALVAIRKGWVNVGE